MSAEPPDDPQSRRDLVEPVPLKTQLPSPDASKGGERRTATHDDQLRKLTIAGFTVLFVLAIGVFFFLPTAVERGRQTPPAADEAEPGTPTQVADEAEPAPALPATTTQPDGAERLAQRREAEDLLAEFVLRGEALDEHGVLQWARAAREASIERAREGERLLRERDYEAARERLAEAVAQIEELELRRDTLKAESLRAGLLALEAGNAAEAREQFELAALIDPDDPTAQTGLARSETIEEVFALLEAGEALEQRGELQQARAQYQQASALDANLERVSEALARVSQQITRSAFQAAMSDAFAKLARENFAAAASSFERALRIRPGSPEAREGLEQAREAGRILNIAEHREVAERAEVEEKWDLALWHYDQALALDPQLAFAQAGAKRAGARATLAVALEKYLNAPDRLSSSDVRKEAAGMLARADAVRTPGPVLREQIDRLAALLEAMSTPVRVELRSDAMTDILVYHVGRLGRFEARQLELAPGRYTVVGTRDGYRDVRRQFTVDAGVSPEPVTVRCEERI